MKGAQSWMVAGLAGLTLAFAAGAASAVDVTDNDRLFRNFTRETATVPEGQVRVELRGVKEQDEGHASLNAIGLHLRSLHPDLTPAIVNPGATVSAGVIDAVASYGFMKNAEAGLVLPGVIESVHYENGPTFNEADIGDMTLYTKFQRAAAEHCKVGAGVELSLPTGSEHKGFGTGQLGVNPILSTRYQRGAFATGLNVGYQLFTDDQPDVFNYGADVILRATETYAVRTEIAGRVFRQGGTLFHDLTVLPGIDVNLAHNLTVRPTGMVGATSPALDWGVGIGIAVSL